MDSFFTLNLWFNLLHCSDVRRGRYIESGQIDATAFGNALQYAFPPCCPSGNHQPRAEKKIKIKIITETNGTQSDNDESISTANICFAWDEIASAVQISPFMILQRRWAFVGLIENWSSHTYCFPQCAVFFCPSCSLRIWVYWRIRLQRLFASDAHQSFNSICERWLTARSSFDACQRHTYKDADADDELVIFMSTIIGVRKGRS